ncbi:hypothetical protein M501DRAFT_985612 [Patellaria atrata CBS 101060]|uniref:Uncharacterized protein n=1 Tax=Patellaria atrata CBS 101060 TaxID=1346257 RepID=A0A9P4SIW1_9PEZI|nr:hypothetical protein M501DRAFT_985612 [Patellaria atrata CBS 101060]
MPTLPNFISVNLVGYQGPQRTLGHTYLNVSDWKARRDLNDMVAPLSIAEVEVDKYAMGTDETRGLRVGMRPRAAPTVRSKGGKASGNSTANNAKVSIPSKGRSIDTVKDWAIIPKDDKALRVVVRADSDAVVVAYFALVNPDDRGLCEAVKIDLEERLASDHSQSSTMSKPKYLVGILSSQSFRQCPKLFNVQIEALVRSHTRGDPEPWISEYAALFNGNSDTVNGEQLALNKRNVHVIKKLILTGTNQVWLAAKSKPAVQNQGFVQDQAEEQEEAYVLEEVGMEE